MVSEKISKAKTVEIETLFIGGGPATLGVLVNAYQTNRIQDLVQGAQYLKSGKKGIAIVEASETFGGGSL
jgi:hypothetical protein